MILSWCAAVCPLYDLTCVVKPAERANRVWMLQVDNRHSNEPIISPEQAAKLCDRNFGIGGDGVGPIVSAQQAGFERVQALHMVSHLITHSSCNVSSVSPWSSSKAAEILSSSTSCHRGYQCVARYDTKYVYSRVPSTDSRQCRMCPASRW